MFSKNQRIGFGATICVAFLSVSATAEIDVSKLPPASTKTGLSYEKDIKPLFEKSCYKCHGPEKQKGKLRLDSLEAVMKGGESGKIIEGKDSAKSTVVVAVSGLDEDTAMPPKDKAPPLTKEEQGLLRAWIEQGSK